MGTHPNISRHILHIVLSVFPKVLNEKSLFTNQECLN